LSQQDHFYEDAEDQSGTITAQREVLSRGGLGCGALAVETHTAGPLAGLTSTNRFDARWRRGVSPQEFGCEPRFQACPDFLTLGEFAASSSWLTHGEGPAKMPLETVSETHSAAVMPNVRHIAKQAGVSITTVSRVLNNHPGVSDAARQAVLAAVNQAGYVPEVGRRSTSNIALLYTDSPTLDSPFDANHHRKRVRMNRPGIETARPALGSG
jgi:hypothetical protein